ncbi:MAG TPA: sigma-54 dependent transcriptional regulator [Thermoanaerobaculia bacterium]|jgi:DNA-binding NtrC family response regulator|nr:sigma-54 dependent transcriptional regulator [Thermoanaerobaculia bacterium]
MPTGRILIVEDRDSLRRMLERALSQEGYEVASAADGQAGIRLVEERAFDFVLTDLKLPDVSGIEVLAASRRAQPRTPVVVLTGFGTVGTAVEAMKLGAYDFREKPVEIDDLSRLIEQAIGERDEAAVFHAPGAPPIVGRHPRLRAAIRLLQKVAPMESTVLLTGESGTGKELFARALHALSPRKDGPFVALNCAAIPESLLENELFGHEKGAFTGADRRQPGRFEMAERGTLMLDEIGELPLAVQGKVLRVLEERTYERVGGGRTMRADVRLVAATNRDLEAMVGEGVFRSDLFFRLNVFPIELPALSERATDIPLIARHLLGEIARRHRLEPPRLDSEAEEILAAQPWPGNVRELANVLERAVILAEGPAIRAADLQPLLHPLSPAGERDRVRQALIDADGDKKKAADLLGMSYRTLQRKVKEHDLEGVPKYRA